MVVENAVLMATLLREIMICMACAYFCVACAFDIAMRSARRRRSLESFWTMPRR